MTWTTALCPPQPPHCPEPWSPPTCTDSHPCPFVTNDLHALPPVSLSHHQPADSQQCPQVTTDLHRILPVLFSHYWPIQTPTHAPLSPMTYKDSHLCLTVKMYPPPTTPSPSRYLAALLTSLLVCLEWNCPCPSLFKCPSAGNPKDPTGQRSGSQWTPLSSPVALLSSRPWPNPTWSGEVLPNWHPPLSPELAHTTHSDLFKP